MMLRVDEPGLYTLVVDLGRPGWRSLGVPPGGAADRAALVLGNALVGNAPEAAALEVSLAGPTLTAGCELACVLYGAPFVVHSDRQWLAVGTTFTLTPGETVQIGTSPQGMRAYFCVRGGLEVPAVLGSHSALAPLSAGVELGCSPGRISGRRLPPCLPGAIPGCPGPLRRESAVLRALPGAQGDWFPPAAVFGDVEDDGGPPIFRVTSASNRMGVRLEGPPLPVPGRELLSEPVCPGTVQVTRDGQCIILGVDGQTIGGYPKIAQVVSADLDLVGQLRPGDRVRFRRVTLNEAERAYRERQARVREWLVRLQAAELFGPLRDAGP
jgi:antagonist of KipI